MTPTNRIARFIEQVEPTPAEHPEPSESRWQPAAAHGCSETEPACEPRLPLCDDDALVVYHVCQCTKDGIEACVGDVLELHFPSFEEIQRRGLSESEIEFTAGVKTFLSGVNLNTPTAQIVDYLRDQALLLIKAADRLEAETRNFPKL